MSEDIVKLQEELDIEMVTMDGMNLEFVGDPNRSYLLCCYIRKLAGT